MHDTEKEAVKVQSTKLSFVIAQNDCAFFPVIYCFCSKVLSDPVFGSTAPISVYCQFQFCLNIVYFVDFHGNCVLQVETHAKCPLQLQHILGCVVFVKFHPQLLIMQKVWSQNMQCSNRNEIDIDSNWVCLVDRQSEF